MSNQETYEADQLINYSKSEDFDQSNSNWKSSDKNTKRASQKKLYKISKLKKENILNLDDIHIPEFQNISKVKRTYSNINVWKSSYLNFQTFVQESQLFI